MWKNRAPEGLTKGDFAELHREVGEDHPTTANRVVETCVTMFNFAQDEGIVDHGFNPAKRVNKYEEKSRDRWLRAHEVSDLADALGEIETPYMRNYYWLLLLTATCCAAMSFWRRSGSTST